MIISTKIGQTSFVNENGTRVSATVLDYNSCTVVGNRTIDKDGYLANIIGFLIPILSNNRPIIMLPIP